MEQDPKDRTQELEKVKVDLNPVRAVKNPAQIPAADQEKDKAEDRAGIKAVLGENKISNIHERKINV